MACRSPETSNEGTMTALIEIHDSGDQDVPEKESKNGVFGENEGLIFF